MMSPLSFVVSLVVLFASLSPLSLPVVSSSSLSPVNDPSPFVVWGAIDPSARVVFLPSLEAYEMTNPQVLLEFIEKSNPEEIAPMILSGVVDYGIQTAPLSSAQQISHPNLSQFPAALSALSLPYRLDSLGMNSPDIQLSREAIAKIFMGNITHWDDSLIQIINKGIALTHSPITVIVQEEVGGMNLVWTTAMSKFYEGFSSAIPPSENPQWPSNFVRAKGISGVASAVLLLDGSIGFSLHTVCESFGMTVAAIINKAGKAVKPSLQSINFAQIELAPQAKLSQTFTTPSLDLTDGSGASDYPIVATSYLIIDLKKVRSTCGVRKEVLRLWLFHFQSALANAMVAAQHAASILTLVAVELNVISNLQNGMKCNEQTVYSMLSDETLQFIRDSSQSASSCGASSLSLSSSSASSSFDVVIGGSSRLSSILSMVTTVFSDQSGISVEFSPLSSDDALQQFMRNEIHMAIVFPEECNEETLRIGRSLNEIITMPIIASQLITVYNTKFIAVLNDRQLGEITHQTLDFAGILENSPLILDFETLTGIILGNITSYTHPDVLALNPNFLQSLQSLPFYSEILSLPITLVVSCNLDEQSEMGLSEQFIRMLQTKVSSTLSLQLESVWNSHLDACVPINSHEDTLLESIEMDYSIDSKAFKSLSYGRGPSITFDLSTPSSSAVPMESSSNSLNVVITQQDSHVTSVIQSILGAMGFVQFNPSDFLVTYDIARMSVKNSNGENIIMEGGDVDLIADCVSSSFSIPSAFHLNGNSVSTDHGGVSSFGLSSYDSSLCWPFLMTAHAIFPSNYQGDSALLNQGNMTLSTLAYILSTHELMKPFESLGTVLLSTISEYQISQLELLNAVQCGESSCLVDLPQYWALSSGVAIFTWIFASLGLLLSGGILLMVWHHRSRSVIRSSSPYFLMTILCGVMLIFLSTYLLIAAELIQHVARPEVVVDGDFVSSVATTDESVAATAASLCNAWSWMLCLGFSICYVPMFSRTWRLFKIFGRRQLRVLKISNRNLAIRCSFVILSVFVVLLAWQIKTGGSRPIHFYQSVGYPPVETIYSHCAANSAGIPFVVILSLLFGGLILFGAIMAFNIRGVASAFNESTQLSWCIYNVIFTVIIFVPIMLFVNVMGDVLTLLIAFLTLWIAFGTMGILFGPKVIVLFKPNEEAALSFNATENSANRTVSQGFSFHSFEKMTLTILQKYIKVLRQQLEAAEEREIELKQCEGDRGDSALGYRKSGFSSLLKGFSTAMLHTNRGENAMGEKETSGFHRRANSMGGQVVSRSELNFSQKQTNSMKTMSMSRVVPKNIAPLSPNGKSSAKGNKVPPKNSFNAKTPNTYTPNAIETQEKEGGLTTTMDNSNTAVQGKLMRQRTMSSSLSNQSAHRQKDSVETLPGQLNQTIPLGSGSAVSVEEGGEGGLTALSDESSGENEYATSQTLDDLSRREEKAMGAEEDLVPLSSANRNFDTVAEGSIVPFVHSQQSAEKGEAKQNGNLCDKL